MPAGCQLDRTEPRLSSVTHPASTRRPYALLSFPHSYLLTGVKSDNINESPVSISKD
jgi:hypothetical protein